MDSAAPSMTSHHGALAGSRKAKSRHDTAPERSSTLISRPMSFWQTASVTIPVSIASAMTRAAGMPQCSTAMSAAGASASSMFRAGVPHRAPAVPEGGRAHRQKRLLIRLRHRQVLLLKNLWP